MARNSFYCFDCLAETKEDCICYKIVGRDEGTGFYIVDNKESEDSREWAFFWNE